MVTMLLPPPQPRATLDDLMRTEGKAELIGGRIVTFMATGDLPNEIAGRIYRKLADYADVRGGHVRTDGIGYRVTELFSGRESFSPDCSYFTGRLPANRMKFIDGPPDFAVEVRSEGDYGTAAEFEMAAKRADYFEAGTLVVWDVDPVAKTVRKYSVDGTNQLFTELGTANAEPAAPGWSLPLDWLFREE
jgi:Uma2 family endonuclease